MQKRKPAQVVPPEIQFAEFQEGWQMFALSRGTVLLATPGFKAGFKDWLRFAVGFDDAEKILKMGIYGRIFNGEMRCIPGGGMLFRHQDVLNFLDLFEAVFKVSRIAIGVSDPKATPPKEPKEYSVEQYRLSASRLIEMQDKTGQG
jgi:hypothetical protein